MMNADTGRLMALRDHIRQSINDILFTRFGARVQREQYGSIIPELLDNPINPEVMPLIVSSGVFMALATYEPRIVLTDVRVDLSGASKAAMVIEIEYQLNGNTIKESIST